MIFLCAGVYAEGPTDDRFLCKLLDRILPPLATEICKGGFDLGETRRIDEPRRLRKASREERIAAAIEESWSECTLFVVHSDGEDAPEEARRARIEPGLARARRTRPDLAAAACVPVRETEAWMLADAEAFCRIFETERRLALPRDPEGEVDPKETLRATLLDLKAPTGRREDYYALLGPQLGEELRAAIRAIATHPDG